MLSEALLRVVLVRLDDAADALLSQYVPDGTQAPVAGIEFVSAVFLQVDADRGHLAILPYGLREIL